MAKSKKSSVPVTKLRIQIPKGVAVRDVIKKLEITFEEAKEGDVQGQFNQNHCCVDVAVVSPVSTIASRPTPFSGRK